ncbi:MAG: hypothetical protein AAB225_10995 [Acidobacteriota bacterium]
MNRLTFHSSDGSEISPKKWLKIWGILTPGRDEQVYRDLIDIAKHKSFSSRDVERIGRWKDNAWAAGKWKPDVAMVAYKIWRRAASELPECPTDDKDAADFLNRWSQMNYTDVRKTGAVVKKRFGLARGTALLHFISGGRYPLLDARVRTAVRRLLSSRAPNTVEWYLNVFYPLFRKIAATCGTKDARTLDQALVRYGQFLDAAAKTHLR